MSHESWGTTTARRHRRVRARHGFGTTAHAPDRFSLVLAPVRDAEDVARELHRRYRDAICLWIGAFPYPWDERRARLAWCDPSPRSTTPLTLAGTVVLDSPIVARGDFIRAKVVITNRGSEFIEFHSGLHVVGELEKPNSRRVGGGYIGALPAIGLTGDLEPGESVVARLVASTGSCDPALGYLLPPGEYDLVARVPLSTRSAPLGGWEETSALLSAPARIRVR